MGSISLAEEFKIVSGTAGCRTTNGGITCDYVSLKNVIKAWIVVHLRQAVSHATVVQPQKATAVLPSGATSVTNSYPWRKNADISASDTLVAQTAATSMAATAGTTDQLMVIEIDPASGEWDEDYDVLGCTLSDSSQATNFASVLYVLQTKYPQATPPAAITD